MTSITFFPVVTTEEQLMDLISRSAWFLASTAFQTIHIPVATHALTTAPWRIVAGMDEELAHNFDALRRKVAFVVADSEAALDASMSSASVILRWKKDVLPSFVRPKKLTEWQAGKKVLQVDPVAIRQEGSFYIEAGLHVLPERAALIAENKQKFETLAAKLGRFERAYVLATGPSVANYKYFDYSKAISIVCNSVILDDELMEHVRPKILVFADPIFHFGPSQYAASFRQKLRRSVAEHDFTICIPFKYYGLFVSAMPDLREKTIAFPFTKERDFNFDLRSDFILRTTANVLTFLMLPLATTFADEIGIMGCDGRPLSENTYFWGHNPNTQINDKMANIREVHPGFFNIDYNDYYSEHCETLGQQLSAGESAGRTFLSLAFSHIPPLRSRFGRGKRLGSRIATDAETTVLFIDPDGKDWSGHYMAYNEKIVKSLAAKGAEVKIVCRKDLAPEILNSRPHYFPVLTAHSWEIGHRRNNEEFIAAFERELFPIVKAESARRRSVLIYMYFGSIEHVSTLAKLCMLYPEVSINVNLHYTSYRIAAPWWIDLWRPWFQWLDNTAERIVATVPTAELQADLADAMGCIFDVAPHPSTGIDDSQFLDFARASDRPTAHRDLNVLFPSAPRLEKGYLASVECARLLASASRIRITIRHAPTSSTPEEISKRLEGMPSNVEVISGVLGNDEFVQLFRSSDIVVLPYSANGFAKRTSGLLIDALYCAVPCVVVTGTWLARLVDRYSCGIVVADDKPETLRDGILKLQADYQEFLAKARQASISYFQNNSWSALAGSVLTSQGGAASAMSRKTNLVVIDLTPIGGLSATGRVKEAFFHGWHQADIQIVSLNASQRKMYVSDINGRTALQASEDEVVIKYLAARDPSVIYYRAVDNEIVHSFAERAIAALSKPLAIHLMDDWPARMQSQGSPHFDRFDHSLRAMLKAARARFSIGEDMSRALEARYGVPFCSFANAIDPAVFPPRQRARKAGDKFVIRYTGALAEDMTLASIVEVATAVQTLSSDLNIRLDIHTRPPWTAVATKAFAAHSSVRVLEQVDSSIYYPLLQDADALLIAYNFDEASRTYVGMSIANKMPEYLASGTPIIAYGPDSCATLRHLKNNLAALVVTEQDHAALAERLRAFVLDVPQQRELGACGRELAFRRHNVWNISRQFRTAVELASHGEDLLPIKPLANALLGPFSRDDHAHWDETMGVANLFSGTLTGTTMIDVGGHHGSALMPFLNQGWRVFAFEPDEKNRAKLLINLANHPDKALVSIDTRCVSNKSQKGLSFYSSEQSTGISGLSAFHTTHVETQRVDTVSLTEFFEGKFLPPVDFLKIDTEGHDLFVLQGFPWDRDRPKVIECEFEDSKTRSLGYTYHDLAGFLLDKGYLVYVSEWHPIIRYGIRHDWHRLTAYPCQLADESSWGNLLAFRDPIGETALLAAIRKVLKTAGANTVKGGGAAASRAAETPASAENYALPASVAARAYTVIPSTHFKPLSANQWCYSHSTAKQKLWQAVFAMDDSTVGRGFVVNLRLMSNRAMTVMVSIGRHGISEYEGATTKVMLAPDVAQRVQVRKEFTRPHEALRAQLDVLELKSGSSANLTIDSVSLAETLGSIRRRVGESGLTLRAANHSFRKGDYSTALGIYLLLQQQRSLGIYPDNALMAARKLVKASGPDSRRAYSSCPASLMVNRLNSEGFEAPLGPVRFLKRSPATCGCHIQVVIRVPPSGAGYTTPQRSVNGHWLQIKGVLPRGAKRCRLPLRMTRSSNLDIRIDLEPTS